MSANTRAFRSGPVRVALCEAQNWRCCYCNTDMTYPFLSGRGHRDVVTVPDNYPTIEHVVPLAFGGQDDMCNIAMACLKCNSNRSRQVTLILKSLDLVKRLRRTKTNIPVECAGPTVKFLHTRAADTIEAFIETMKGLV